MKFKKILLTLFLSIYFLPIESKELENCVWKNEKGTPCLTIFSAPNTSKISEYNINKVVITKKQIIDSGYDDLRSLLEGAIGVDVYGDGPKGQKTSVFMRGTNSNHTLVLLNGIPINDQSSPKAMFDFGYDFLQGLQQVEIYKGASGAIFGPAAIGGAINLITDIDYENSISVSGSHSRTNSINGNYFYISDSGWHHNIKGGTSQIEELSTQNTSKDLDGTKNVSLNYNSMKFINDNLKLNFTGYGRKTDSGYDSWDDANANADNIMYAFQSSLESKKKNIEDKLISHFHVHDRYYDTAVKNKYYSQSIVFKGERKINFLNNLSFGIGSDYNYAKGDFKVHGSWGSSAKGHMDNLGIFSNMGYKHDDSTIFSAHLRGDKHKYSNENLTYKIGLTKLFEKFSLNFIESTGLRHPDLFVLHGANTSGSYQSMKTTKPETSFTRELTAKFNISSNIEINTTAYKGTISDVLNRGTSTYGYNEIIDIKQEGIENSFFFNKDNQRLVLTSTFSKSREGDGTPQLRRPEQKYSIKYSKNFKSSFLGPFNINYDYNHIGKVEDWKNGTARAKVDSTDIMNFSISKDLFGSRYTLKVLNLTDEIYQRPDTYNQEGRRFNLSFISKY